jgi:hypothetical protein
MLTKLFTFVIGNDAPQDSESTPVFVVACIVLMFGAMIWGAL